MYAPNFDQIVDDRLLINRTDVSLRQGQQRHRQKIPVHARRGVGWRGVGAGGDEGEGVVGVADDGKEDVEDE